MSITHTKQDLHMEPGCDGHILDTDIEGAEYWRGKAKEWKEEWQEFQQETRDLELELEAQLVFPIIHGRMCCIATHIFISAVLSNLEHQL